MFILFIRIFFDMYCWDGHSFLMDMHKASPYTSHCLYSILGWDGHALLGRTCIVGTDIHF